jgi:phosphoserine phosphatase RsbU/P
MPFHQPLPTPRPPLPRIIPAADQPSVTIKQMLEFFAQGFDGRIINTFLKKLLWRYNASERALREANTLLQQKQARLDEDLKAAAAIQRALLPRKKLQHPAIKSAWILSQSEQVGGDGIFLHERAHNRLVASIADVSGHGVPAAMIMVTISQALTGYLATVGDGSPHPAALLDYLETEYPFKNTSKYYTLATLVLDLDTGTLLSTSGGHPYPLVLHPDGTLISLAKGNTPIGMNMGDLTEFDELPLQRGSRVFLFSDGITEAMNPSREQFGDHRLTQCFLEGAGLPLEASVSLVESRLTEFLAGQAAQDDVSLLALEWGS